MSKKLNLYSLFTILLFLFSSCAEKQKFTMAVSAIASNDPSGKKYIILPGHKDVKENELQFQEYKNIVVRALQNSGYQLATSDKDAEIKIFLYYGISNPKERVYAYSTPIYGETGIASSVTHGSSTAVGNHHDYSSFTTYTPTYGVRGYENRVGTYITYNSTLVLSAITNKDKSGDEVWKVKVENTGSINDLRQIFPAMTIAAEPYFGQNSSNKITVEIMGNDERINQIRGIAPKAQTK